MNIKEHLKKLRPNLSNSSINTYNSILTNLYKKVFGDKDIKLDDFDNDKDILKYLKTIPPNKRKTILSALFVISDNENYRELMLEDISDYNSEIDKQEKTEDQKENWVETKDLSDILNIYSKEFKHLINKVNFIPDDYQEIQKYILLILFSGEYIPPRRSKDYCDFKIDNIDPKKDNYLKANKMYFNSYKTSKTYGEQVVKIPITLKNILLKWIRINPTDYLFFDKNGNKLSSVKMNQRLNKLFNKKVGVNAMRKTYLTNKYKDVSDKLDEIEKDFKDMGSSKIQFKTYVKKD